MAKAPAEKANTTVPSEEVPICGVIRPIAELDGYPASHWLEVHAIIADAVDAAGHRARLVSESDSAGVILSEIVTNLYNDEIVICDVSGRNANVMFELGMRLAFEKPAIVIKDDATPFSFDISPVKHLVYPRSLRFQAIVEFKADLARAITATLATAKEQRGYLQQFGPIQVTQLGEQNLTLDAFAEELRDTRRMLRSLQFSDPVSPNTPSAKMEPSQVISFDIRYEQRPTVFESLKAVVGSIVDSRRETTMMGMHNHNGVLSVNMAFPVKSNSLAQYASWFRAEISSLEGVIEVNGPRLMT